VPHELKLLSSFPTRGETVKTSDRAPLEI